tara:strand:- start:667 stop:861 length:195 start_codon:yes stop_codon:yes gene_type:complete
MNKLFEKDNTNIKNNILINAIEDGWNVQKKGDYYIFRKKHENRREILSDEYLKKFLIVKSKDHR